MTGRFAPSPTGRMHLGNIYSALLSWLSARSQGGEWILRIEDIDPQRSRKEFSDLIMDDLQWLGLSWDGEPFYQSERSDIYEHYLQQLQQSGLVYPCYCTRADILATQAPHESDGRVVYKGTCRPRLIPSSANDTPHTLSINDTTDLLRQEERAAASRLIVPDSDVTFIDGHYGKQTTNLASHCGDFIVRRKDGAWAYQLAVVVDDALMGVTEVVRGRDLLLSSPQQIYLARQLGFTPPAFCHLPLLCNTDGQRLSKRDKSLDLAALRQRCSAGEIIGKLAFHAGLIPSPDSISAKELIPLFSWDKVPLQDIEVAG